MKNFVSGITRFFNEEEGATAVEYGVMVALIAVAIIVTVQLLGQKLDQIFQLVNTKLGTVT